ncbi:peptidase S41 protein [Flavobacterium rivuli WB 3.3-2 = DSM 21788]|uniref:Peptidase S41 protein n=1 Tax=Flavobacterium rivuli WB 3.3-2 = DSM 21788 TaxID=1121895 RepID=A0A0A2M6H9_9FLAO|nr:S41 family peptidase [Flavobacterium rivuli]KGO87058.1 peptidase S41 protein [Flavobacterium rivuli WB 3.3-2 = DSM 21788]
MKKVFALLFIFSLHLNAQQTSASKDSISVFYGKLFSALKKEYLYKDKTDWKVVEAETNKNLLQYENFKESLKEVAVLFGKIEATHCKVFYQDKGYSVPVKFLPENFSDQWKAKYASKPAFEAKVIDGKYAYILIPAITFSDVSSKNIHKIAQPLYDKIAALKTQNNIEGWIIDLRFNTGGNIYPMLLALYDLLGDDNVWGTLDINKKQIGTIELSGGKYIDNSSKVSYIDPKGVLLDKAKVAVITGSLTASSGEVTAMAFKGRPNAIFIGEQTMGMTTSNSMRSLPYGATLVLSIAYDCDRNGVFYEHIVPDIAISKKDNLDDLLSDENIQEAIKFIDKK